MTLPALGLALLIGTLPLLWLPVGILWLLPVLLLLRLWLARTLTSKLGGYTGDALGAAQQLSETVFYLGAVALL